jgi:hypothetical protein
MRLFCRENHNVGVEPDEPTDYEQELLEARAKLARLKKLPKSSFSKHGIRYMNGQPIVYSVGTKVNEVAKQKAVVAELEILVNVQAYKELGE